MDAFKMNIRKVKKDMKQKTMGNSLKILKKKLHKWKNVDIKQLLIDISLHSNKNIDGKDEKLIMIRQYKPTASSSSKSMNMGEVLLLNLSQVAQFKDSLDTIQFSNQENIQTQYKEELAFVYATLMKDYFSDIAEKYNQGGYKSKENHQKIIQILRLKGSINERISLCIDDLFHMVDINEANKCAFDRIKKSLILPINSMDVFLNKEALKNDMNWLIDMRRNLFELMKSVNVDLL